MSSAYFFFMNYRTRQREAVLQVLSRAGKPLTAQTIFRKAGDICPGIGAATVFRTLKDAIRAGEIVKVELPGLPPHYEIRQDRHHHFFVCQRCNEVQPLQGCVQGLAKLLPKGSRMTAHEVVIYGDCPACASR